MKKLLVLLIVCLLLGCLAHTGMSVTPEFHPAEEILANADVVQKTIEAASLAKTAKSVCVSEDIPVNANHLLSRREASVSYPFIKACEKLESNPISAFVSLVNQGLYQTMYVSDDTTEAELLAYVDSYAQYRILCNLEEKATPPTIKKYRSHCDEAAFVKDVLQTSALLEDGIKMEELILKASEHMANMGIRECAEENVSYAYYVYSTDLFANVLCIYIHHDESQELITDVEFQLLTLSYYTHKANMDSGEDCFDPTFGAVAQLISLIDAVEINLTGTSIFHQHPVLYYKNMTGASVHIPTEYTMGDYTVTVNQSKYETSEIGNRGDRIGYEYAVLTNYRIRK